MTQIRNINKIGSNSPRIYWLIIRRKDDVYYKK